MDRDEILYLPHGDLDPENDDVWLRMSDDPEIRLIEVRIPRRRDAGTAKVSAFGARLIRDVSLMNRLSDRMRTGLGSIRNATDVTEQAPGLWTVRGDASGEELARVAATVVDGLVEVVKAQIPTFSVWMDDLANRGELLQCDLCGRSHPPGPPHKNPWVGPMPPAWGGYPPGFEKCDFLYEIWATEDDLGSSFEMNPDTDRNVLELLGRLIEIAMESLQTDRQIQQRLDSPTRIPLLDAPAGFLIFHDDEGGYGIGFGPGHRTYDGRIQQSPYVYSELLNLALLDLHRRRSIAEASTKNPATAG